MRLFFSVFETILPQESIDVVENNGTYRSVGRDMRGSTEEVSLQVRQSDKERKGSLGAEHMQMIQGISDH